MCMPGSRRGAFTLPTGKARKQELRRMAAAKERLLFMEEILHDCRVPKVLQLLQLKGFRVDQDLLYQHLFPLIALQ